MNMKLKDIPSVSGQPGLYKFVAQSKNGVIVESLADGKRSNVTSNSRVSALGEISVYTETDEVSLGSILEAMYKKFEGGQAINHKSSPGELRGLFSEVLPEYDRDRVHVSDMKKIVSWYNILSAAGMSEFTVEPEGEDPEAPEEMPEGAE